MHLSLLDRSLSVVLVLILISLASMKGLGFVVTKHNFGRRLHNRCLTNCIRAAEFSDQFSRRYLSSGEGDACLSFDKTMETHRAHMFLALRHAQFALRDKEIPIGAVIVDEKGNVLAAARNSIESSQDVTKHAEIECIRKASKLLKSWRLSKCTLYTTLQPCPMCMGAILNSRINTLVIGAKDTSAPSSKSLNETFPFHKVKIIENVLGEESSILLKRFFQERRKENQIIKINSNTNTSEFCDRGDCF